MGVCEDLDEPLALDVHAQLVSDFLDANGWPHLAADKVASDSILGRMRREFLRKQPMILPVLRIRTHLAPWRGRRCLSTRAFLSTWMTKQWKNVRRRAGINKVEWDGQQIRYSHGCQAEEYCSVFKDRVLDLQRFYTEQSIVRWVTRIEEYFRVKAVELARTPRGQVPWSSALLGAQKKLKKQVGPETRLLYTTVSTEL